MTSIVCTCRFPSLFFCFLFLDILTETNGPRGFLRTYSYTTISNGVSLLLLFFSVSVPKQLTDGRISCRVIYNVFEITTGSTGNQFSPRARMQLVADAQLVINTFNATTTVRVPSSSAAYIIIAADGFFSYIIIHVTFYQRRFHAARVRLPPTDGVV